MFDIKIFEGGEIELHGRLDASQVDKADEVLAHVDKSTTINLKNLEYISSAGLGVLLAHQKRLKSIGHALKLIGPNKHVKDILTLTGFDQVFEIE
ncbi:MAG: STAS domain-containing protein [Ignavibacteriales bacterium]|nr:STAS domain-containing protein [Ignavibacteriales bacterium]